MTNLSAKVAEKFGNRKMLPPIDLQKYISLDESARSYRLYFGTTANTSFTGMDYRDAFSKLFGNKLSLVESSLRKISENNRQDYYTTIVTANMKIEPYTDELATDRGLVCLSSAQTTNIFMDKENNIWECVGDGDNKMLVQTSDDNYEDIIKKRVSRSLVVSNVMDNSTIDFSNGDYSIYFNPKTRDVSHGFIYRVTEPASNYSVKVFDRTAQKEVVISEHHVINAVDLEDKNPFSENSTLISTASMNKDSAKKYLNYMRQLFRDTNFYNALEKQLSIRLAIGPNGL